MMNESELDGLGKVVEVTKKKLSIFFKVPPSNKLADALLAKKIMLSEYTNNYKSGFSLADSRYKEMQPTLTEFSLLNPYTSEEPRGTKREVEDDISVVIPEELNFYN